MFNHDIHDIVLGIIIIQVYILQILCSYHLLSVYQSLPVLVPVLFISFPHSLTVCPVTPTYTSLFNIDVLFYKCCYTYQSIIHIYLHVQVMRYYYMF